MRNSRRRPRAWSAIAAASTVLVAATACGSLPDGVDGDLVDAWGGFAEPVGFTPDPAVCHQDSYQQVGARIDYSPVDCEQPHLTQTGFVGEFTDEDADSDEAPEPGSASLRRAYRECEGEIADYLGADFRFGRLWLGVTAPSQAGWDGGARWFRCELVEVESIYGAPVERQGSLAGALEGDSDLRLRCFSADVNDDGQVEGMAAVGCADTHDAEFVGVWRAPSGDYLDPSDSDAETTVYEGCREQVAEYVDVPVDGSLQNRTGAIADWMSEDDWRAGDRSFRCYLWLPERELTESLAGAGEDALPVLVEE